MSIEAAFHERMLGVYHQVGRSTGYWPHYFWRKVKKMGGLAAAKSWINDYNTVSNGFRRLAQIGRLEFAMESLILRKPWSQLFTAAEREIARRRLQDFGHDPEETVTGHATAEDWTVLRHYVVYHNPEQRGFLLRSNTRKSIVTSKPVRHMIGNRVWLVTGEGTPRRYFLAATFVVDRIGTDGPVRYPNRASSKVGQIFRPLLPMDNAPWFHEFLEYNGNFAFGMNEFTAKPKFVEGLWHLINHAQEEKIEEKIRRNPEINETTKQALIDARRGQGLFRKRLQNIERCCRLTKIHNPEHLIASHSKPWSISTDEERLDGNNGLLLSPNVDHLFNMGMISFADEGDLLISPRADELSLQRLGIRTVERVNVGKFRAEQQKYLAYHREKIFKRTQVYGE